MAAVVVLPFINVTAFTLSTLSTFLSFFAEVIVLTIIQYNNDVGNILQYEDFLFTLP